jgi:hypothetical protein
MPGGKDMIKELFSDEHIKSTGIDLVGAYMSCPTMKELFIRGFS